MGSDCKIESLSKWLLEEIYVYIAFWILVSALPALAFSYLVVRISKHLWLKLLSSRYPGLEFIRTDTVRSLLDTHRNQGVINVLLSIKGSLNPEEIKQQLSDHIIERKDNNGKLLFPRLRHVVVSCWGNYAWKANVTFQPDDHFIVTNGVYRGRPVNDSNIQEYVSEIVSKYFPNDKSPWQYIIIPISTAPKYYILIRVHHLLLTGKDSINIGDLLMMEQIKQSDKMSSSEYATSPLTKLFSSHSAIPELWQNVSEIMSNAWNEFILEYDPVESPRAHKTLAGAFHVAGLFLISTAGAIRELSKRSSGGRGYTAGSLVRATTLIAAFQEECKRRNLTILKIMISPLVTMDPCKWPRRTLRACAAFVKCFFVFPLRVRDELLALYELKQTGVVSYSNTITWKYSTLAQLLVRAADEVWRGAVEVYRAPAKLWQDTLSADDGQRNILQTVSLCGRKVAAWSDPVSRASVERTAKALQVSATDITIFAATEALRAFFEHTQNFSPDVVLTTARAASEDFLFTFAEGDGKKYKKSQTGGMVCLTLPIGASPRRIASVVQQSCSRQVALAAAWSAQAQWGALTRAVPSPFARLTLNMLSRKYAVSYAEIDAPINARPRTTLWGQTVDSVIYWRPPQANISMSLTVIQYADTIRLAVMTDARLSPSHTIPATRWSKAIEQLVSKVDTEVARISQVPTTTAVDRDRSNTEVATLKPPAREIVSPPPTRRRITDY